MLRGLEAVWVESLGIGTIRASVGSPQLVALLLNEDARYKMCIK